jgi:membrane protease YdiL (CAAX protease family)
LTTRLQQLWTWRDAAIVVIVFFTIYGLSIPLQFGMAELTGEMATFHNSDNPSIPASALLVNHIGKAIGLIGGVLFIGMYRKNYLWRTLGFLKPSMAWLAVSVAIAVMLFPARLLLSKWLVANFPDLEWGAGGVLLNNDYSLMFHMVLLVILTTIVPVSEELFYRGFIFRFLRSRRPLWAAILFSSIMFGVSHLVPIGIIMSVGLSIVITLVYHHTNSLWNEIAIHATNNLLGVVVALTIS